MSIGHQAKFASDSMAHGNRYRPICAYEVPNCVVPLGVRKAVGFPTSKGHFTREIKGP